MAERKLTGSIAVAPCGDARAVREGESRTADIHDYPAATAANSGGWMMEPISPGIVGADPKSVYGYPTSPNSTDEGNAWSDDAPGSNVTLVTAGYTASVHRQPNTAGVSVTVNSDGSGYRVDTPALPQLNSGNIADSFAWIARKAGSPDVGPFSVPLEIVNAAG